MFRSPFFGICVVCAVVCVFKKVPLSAAVAFFVLSSFFGGVFVFSFFAFWRWFRFPFSSFVSGVVFMHNRPSACKKGGRAASLAGHRALLNRKRPSQVPYWGTINADLCNPALFFLDVGVSFFYLRSHLLLLYL